VGEHVREEIFIGGHRSHVGGVMAFKPPGS
jgi:hypothetical protein